MKTVDQYYWGANQTIQAAGVQYVLDTVVQVGQIDHHGLVHSLVLVHPPLCLTTKCDCVQALVANPNRKFVYAEMVRHAAARPAPRCLPPVAAPCPLPACRQTHNTRASPPPPPPRQSFFTRWWDQQDDEMRETVAALVAEGRLDFVNGGYVQHDEATAHYAAMIDQTTLGHRFLKKTFGKVPRVGWQVDPFGHSATQAGLLGAAVGFDALFFGRADYQDMGVRKAGQQLEVVWRGSGSLREGDADIFAGNFASGASAGSGSTGPCLPAHTTVAAQRCTERRGLIR